MWLMPPGACKDQAVHVLPSGYWSLQGPGCACPAFRIFAVSAAGDVAQLGQCGSRLHCPGAHRGSLSFPTADALAWGSGSSPIFVMKVLNEAVSCLLASPEGFC